MTDPTVSSDPAVPPPPQQPGGPPPTAPAPASPSAMGSMPTDPGSRAIVGAGAAVAVIALLGVPIGAWRLDWTGLILILAGLLAAAAAWMTADGRPVRTMPIAARDVGLAGGTVAAVLGVLLLAQIITDLDDLGDYGEAVGVVLTVLAAVAGVALYVAVTRRWFASPTAPWMDASRAGQAARLIVLGAVVATLGWLGNVTYGVWRFEPSAQVLTLILLAAVVAQAASAGSERLDGRVGAVATVVLVALAALLALSHTGPFISEGFGIDDWIPQLAYLAGVVLQAVGAALWARDVFMPSSGAAGQPA